MTSKVFGSNGRALNHDIIACLIDHFSDKTLCRFVQTCRSIHSITKPIVKERKLRATYTTITTTPKDLRFIWTLKNDPKAIKYVRNIIRKGHFLDNQAHAPVPPVRYWPQVIPCHDPSFDESRRAELHRSYEESRRNDPNIRSPADIIVSSCCPDGYNQSIHTNHSNHRQSLIQSKVPRPLTEDDAFTFVFDQVAKLGLLHAGERQRLRTVIGRSDYRLSLLWSLSLIICPNIERLAVTDSWIEWLWSLTQPFTQLYWVTLPLQSPKKLQLGEIVLHKISHLVLGRPLARCHGSLTLDCTAFTWEEFWPLCLLPNLKTLTVHRVGMPMTVTEPLDLDSPVPSLEYLNLIQSHVGPELMAKIVGHLPNLKQLYYDSINDLSDTFQVFNNYLNRTPGFVEHVGWSIPDEARNKWYVIVLSFLVGRDTMSERNLAMYMVRGALASYGRLGAGMVVENTNPPGGLSEEARRCKNWTKISL